LKNKEEVIIMKKSKKYVIFVISTILIIAMYETMSLGFVAKGDVAPTTQIVSRGVAILLSCMQVLEFAIPILFFIIKLIINKKKQNNKNTLKNICLYLCISIFIFLVFVEIGNLILKNTSTYGYSSKTIDYIYYNRKYIYFHR
jgi:glucan phosphoethanolaminetransferase (alkaline phosphatase superfamily)